MKWTLAALNIPFKNDGEHHQPVHITCLHSTDQNSTFIILRKWKNVITTHLLFRKKGLSTLSKRYLFSMLAWTCEIKDLLCWPLQPGLQFLTRFWKETFVYIRINIEMCVMNLAAALNLKGPMWNSRFDQLIILKKYKT